MEAKLSVEIRQPTPPEWKACRMLLPECFSEGAPPEAFLAFDNDRKRIAGAVVFRSGPKEIVEVRVHVTREYRRTGIGTALLQRVCDEAAQRNLNEVNAWTDLKHEPDAESFLSANSFRRGACLHLVEGDLSLLIAYLSRLHQSLVKAGRIPTSAILTSLSGADYDELARLYASYIAAARYFLPAFVLPLLRNPRMSATSTVLQVDGSVRGFIFAEHDSGDPVMTVHAKVVLPGYRGGWANCLLMLRSANEAWAGGARRVRFEFWDDNSDTKKLMTRCHAEVMQSRCSYVRTLSYVANEHTSAPRP